MPSFNYTEQLLQFIWLHKYYNKPALTTLQGEAVSVLFAGQWNTNNEGPDFSEAHIKIGNTDWYGNIEVHIKTSHWLQHKHQNNKHYENVILHVVYENDIPLETLNMPTVALQHILPHSLLNNYEALMQQNTLAIPCANSINQVKDITLLLWQQKMVVERLMQKTNKIFEALAQSKEHWEAIFWHALARNFGLKVNADTFEQMANSIDVNILYKHKTNFLQLEALLLGQAGLLSNSHTDNYAIMLYKEHQYLKAKWKLTPIAKPISFLRMRPANFPTLRLSQLAQLINKSHFLLSAIKEHQEIATVKKLLKVVANNYWDTHFTFDEQTTNSEKALGSTMIDNICINTIIPFVYAWGKYYKDQQLQDKAIAWLEQLKAESNTITKIFEGLNLKAKNAAESQGQIYLYNQYCTQKKCLECSIGNSILKKSEF
jgi:hypothetical protein